MPREPRDVTDAELAILQLLWDRGRLSIRQLTDVLHPDSGPAQYATVKKQLARMEAKRLVRRDRSLFVHLFSPAIERQELVGRHLRNLAEKICGGSFAPIVGYLGSAKALTPQERRALRQIIDGAGAAEQSKGKRAGRKE